MTRKRKRSELRRARDVTLLGATALQGVQVLRDVRAGASLTPHVGGFLGIGIAGAASEIALNLFESSKPKRKTKRR